MSSNVGGVGSNNNIQSGANRPVDDVKDKDHAFSGSFINDAEEFLNTTGKPVLKGPDGKEIALW